VFDSFESNLLSVISVFLLSTSISAPKNATSDSAGRRRTDWVSPLEEDAEVLVEQEVGVEHDRALGTFHAPFTLRSTSSRQPERS